MKYCTGDSCSIKQGICCCECDNKDVCDLSIKCHTDTDLAATCSDVEERDQ